MSETTRFAFLAAALCAAPALAREPVHDLTVWGGAVGGPASHCALKELSCLPMRCLVTSLFSDITVTADGQTVEIKDMQWVGSGIDRLRAAAKKRGCGVPLLV